MTTYVPITDKHLSNAATSYASFMLALYETAEAREDGDPMMYLLTNFADAYTEFTNECVRNNCVELRGVDPDGKQIALFIGGTDADVSCDGEAIIEN